jgi:hypothetical protein
MWTNEMLKATMDDVERGTHSLRNANKLWHPNELPYKSLNGKTKFEKVGLGGVLIKEENVVVIK